MEDLNSNELETLRVLWQDGPLKPGEIQERFGWTIENATLRSVLRVLMDKGHVTRTKQGKAFFYQAKSSQPGMMASMAKRMAEVFAGGSRANLIAQLIRTERLSKKEIEELRRIAEDKSPGGHKAK